MCDKERGITDGSGYFELIFEPAFSVDGAGGTASEDFAREFKFVAREEVSIYVVWYVSNYEHARSVGCRSTRSRSNGGGLWIIRGAKYGSSLSPLMVLALCLRNYFTTVVFGSAKTSDDTRRLYCS